jgi:muscleblind
MQQMGMPPTGQPIITNQIQPMVSSFDGEIVVGLQKQQYFIQAPNAYIAGVPASNHYNPYYPGQLVPTILGPDPSTVSQASVSPQMTQCVPQAVPIPQQQKHHPQPTDRIEVK